MNTVDFLTLMRLFFLNLITVVVVGVSVFSPSVLFTIEAVSSVLPLSLPEVDILFMFARSLLILSNEDV
jgi:hypothetical protein